MYFYLRAVNSFSFSSYFQFVSRYRRSDRTSFGPDYREIFAAGSSQFAFTTNCIGKRCNLCRDSLLFFERLRFVMRVVQIKLKFLSKIGYFIYWRHEESLWPNMTFFIYACLILVDQFLLKSIKHFSQLNNFFSVLVATIITMSLLSKYIQK